MKPKDWIELLAAICAVDSRTEAGAKGTTEVSARLGQVLQGMEFALSWVDPAPEEGVRGRHLCARRNPGGVPKVLLVAHTDTVLSPEAAPFRVDREQGRVFGSGTCDLKGGCVLMLAATQAALEKAEVRDAELVVLLNCSEEIGSPSFASLARREARGARACLVFEPARLGPGGEYGFVGHRKGLYRFLLRCRGLPAHSGEDHALGVSAIRELARKIEALESLTNHARGLTVNVGRVQGGNAVNQVPDEAVAWFEVRAYDPPLLEEARASVLRICTEPTVRRASDGAATQLEISDLPGFPAWPRHDRAASLTQRYIELAGRRGIVAAAVGSGGGSDGNHVADLTPTLDGLGVLGGMLHQPGEWADWKSFPDRSRVAADLIVDLCAGAGDAG
jgi:glutamate carboxypeptidase